MKDLKKAIRILVAGLILAWPAVEAVKTYVAFGQAAEAEARCIFALELRDEVQSYERD